MTLPISASIPDVPLGRREDFVITPRPDTKLPSTIIAPVDTRLPPAVPQLVRLAQQGDGIRLELLPPDRRLTLQEAKAIVAEVRDRLRQAEEQARTSPHREEANRLGELLSTTSAALAEAKTQATQATAALRQAWAEGTASTAKLDKAQADAERKVEMLTPRVEHLRPLAEAAGKKANSAAAQLLRDVRAGFVRELAARREAALKQLHDAIQGPLGELLAVGLAIDALHQREGQ